MVAKIQKEARHTKIVTTRLTKEEFKTFKKLCKNQKITISWLIRSSLYERLKNNLVPTMPK